MTTPFRPAVAGLWECEASSHRFQLVAAAKKRHENAYALPKHCAKCKLGAVVCAACSRSVGVLSALRD